VTSFVSFDDVWLAYNDELLAAQQFAVEAITLRAEPGEFIAIVGPSGCGKSTFMKLATGLRMPSKGTVLVDGRQVSGPLKITGMAFQSSSLLPWRTTLDNVLLPLEIVEPHRSNFRSQRGAFVEKARKLLPIRWPSTPGTPQKPRERPGASGTCWSARETTKEQRRLISWRWTPVTRRFPRPPDVPWPPCGNGPRPRKATPFEIKTFYIPNGAVLTPSSCPPAGPGWRPPRP